MLKIETINDSTKNLLAPSVYIDSVELESNLVKVFFSLEDENNSWINVQELLNSFKVYFSYSYANVTKTEVFSLLKLRNNSIIKNNSIISSIVLKIPVSEQRNLTITAFCGNELVQGAKTTEKITKNDKYNNFFLVMQSNFNQKNLNFLNKIKNLNLLNIPFQIFSRNPQTQQKKLPSYDLFSSYTINKQADFGFIFDLEQFLNVFSNSYRVLSPYPEFKKNILDNSFVDLDKTSFFKRIKKNPLTEYKKINNKAKSYKLSDSNYKFIITSSQIEEEKVLYDVKVQLFVNDYSAQFVEDILNYLNSSLEFIKNYKNILEKLSKNQLIQNINQYYFENYYSDEIIKRTTEIVNNLSYVCIGVFATNPSLQALEKEFISLFLSILHPLTTNANLLTKLENFILKLLSNFYKITEKITNQFSNDKETSGLIKELDYTFNFSSGLNNSYLDYLYDKNYGYEVLLSDTFRNRQKQNPPIVSTNDVFRGFEPQLSTESVVQSQNFASTVEETREIGFRVVSKTDLDLRKTLEARKYLNNTVENVINSVKTFSISFLDVGDLHFNFISDNSQNILSNTRIAYLKLKEYNDFNFNYRNAESFFYQLAENNVIIKTISSAVNESKNDLLKSTLFDPNLDSSQKSLEFITSTGIEELFYSLDDVQYKHLPAFSFQYSASSFTANELNPIYSSSYNKNINETPRNTFLFNSVFNQYEIASGNNYKLIKLNNLAVNDVFTKKIRHFNSTFIELIKRPQPVPEKRKFFNDVQEASINVLPKFFNRSVQKGNFLINLEQI